MLVEELLWLLNAYSSRRLCSHRVGSQLYWEGLETNLASGVVGKLVQKMLLCSYQGIWWSDLASSFVMKRFFPFLDSENGKDDITFEDVVGGRVKTIYGAESVQTAPDERQHLPAGGSATLDQLK